ncbi:glutamine synthetase [Amycolatopsis endophytica]|uniref:Glutamine synthetase n=1 Tax=Amycolatopsis endophytica TaxID=860233 RepID=A0A853B7Q8_9PSEU|nr:glutamine synthetase family protein [Amycolatopsis endophytica]NYI91333.1 glutamine synthetase [Amycolatopsis endophytica]
MSATATTPAGTPPADVRSLLLLFPDLHGGLRGKMVEPRLVDDRARAEGLPTTDLLLAVDPRDEPITTLPSMGLNGGAKDLLLRPDETTWRPVPWFPDSALLLGDLHETSGLPCEVSPRQVLRRALGALADQGLRVRAAFEFEFRLFRAGGWEPATSGLSYSPLTLSEVAGFLGTLRHYADALRLDLSVVHAEGAPGLIEVNVDPQDGLAAADTAALLRLAAAEAARPHGLRASFLAKPFAREEGSSAHVHFSLWDESGANVLRSAETDLEDETYRRIAWGVLANLPALSLVYNPTINSYKRLVPGYFAPVRASCGTDDRSFALRALLRGPSSSRFELRRPGADCNPYLTLAAIAASVHLGLIEPSIPDRGGLDRYDEPLPSSLDGAVAEFRRRDAGLDKVLGAGFCEYYLRTREWELHAWQNAVTEWERERYS